MVGVRVTHTALSHLRPRDPNQWVCPPCPAPVAPDQACEVVRQQPYMSNRCCDEQWDRTRSLSLLYMFLTKPLRTVDRTALPMFPPCSVRI